MNSPSAPPVTNLDMETEKINMFFSATNLPSRKGTTDAFASIYMKDNLTGTLNLLTHTEVMMDTNHPTWMTNCVADYQFQDIQQIVVKVYHKQEGVPVGESSAHVLLGEASFHQSALMISHGSKMQILLSKDGHTGVAKLTVRGEAVACTRDILCVGFQCKNLVRKNGLGIFGKSDPYIKISRKFHDNTFSVVWQSRHITGDLNPLFAHNRISMLSLCNGDINKEISVDLYDYDEAGNHKHMGGFKTTVLELLHSNGKPFTLIEEARVGSFMYSDSGTFSCVGARIESHPTLGQYIMGGLEISLSVAIDFTASNGCTRDGRPDNTSRKSLHRVGEPGYLNDYEKAILAVGSVIEPYSSAKQFSVYGFGAKIYQDDGSLSPVQHCFPIYGGESLVNGTSGIIQAYHDCLHVVSLSGPTNFSPLIDCGGYLATQRGCTQEKQSYTVLMILTDGILDDLEETIQSIIRASTTPLSILIIGIGNADFSAMSVLDADDKMLEQGGLKAARDIVQFVPFKKFMQKGPVALAQSILAEIPSQVIKYMEQNKITPNPPPAFDEAPPPAFDEAPPPY